MKIDKVVNPQPLTYEKSAKTKQKSGTCFDELLGNQLSQTQGPSAPASPEVAAMDPAGSLVGLNANQSSELARASTAVEDALDQWSTLSDLLQAPDVSPKEIQKQIESLTRQTQELQNRLQAVPQDHPVRQIADELAVFSYVESVKWNRGDYL